MHRIIDSHCHIYPDSIAAKAIYSVDHFYDGLPSCTLDGTARTLLTSGRAAGISHFIVHSVATTPKQVSSINHFLADAMNHSGGAFTALGALHPDAASLEDDLKELLSLGLHGVKIHPDFQQFEADSPKAFRIYELCQAYGLPVLVHTGDFRYDYSNPERVVNVLRAFPDLKFIGAHLGGWSVWDRATALLPDFPNIMVDTSSSFPWLKREEALDIIRAYGAERVLFGTDYPMWPQKPDLDHMKMLELTEDEYDQIFWRNCARLYGIPLWEEETTA